MARTCVLIIVLSSMIGCKPKVYSTAYNFDFEYIESYDIPIRWELPDANYHGYETSVDKSERENGQRSLKMTRVDSAKSNWVIFCQELPSEMLKGSEIELRGWIKSEKREGFADIFIVESDNYLPCLISMVDDKDAGVKKSTDWTQVSTKKEICEQTKSILIGGILTDDGTAWFDNFELFIDGVKFVDSFIAPPKTKLTSKDKKELRKYVYPLKIYDADSEGGNDLSVFSELTDGCEIVGLGENTHGSSEIFKMKHRIIKYLALNENFNVFSIEASMPESYKLNEYILEGEGDPKQLIRGMYFWIWNTQEMLDLVEWMHDFSGPGSQILYTGFDMQFYTGAIAVLRNAFSEYKSAVELIDKAEAKLDKVLTYSSQGIPAIELPIAADINNILEQLQVYIDKLNVDQKEKDWLSQNITLLYQYIGQGNPVRREESMAENLLWIKQQTEPSNIIAWTHNGHVQKNYDKMGSFLYERLRNAYTAIGFTFYDGSYSAIKPGSNQFKHSAQCAYPGTLEYLLMQLNEPVFVLDLKKIKADNSPIMEWIDDLKYRHVGAVKVDSEFTDYHITDAFDYLIFIRNSSPSHLLVN